MSEIKNYFKVRMRTLFEARKIFNIDLAILIWLVILVLSVYAKNILSIAISAIIVLTLILYKDYKGGSWKHEMREQYKGVIKNGKQT